VGVGVAHGGKMVASKHGFSFATCSVAALSLLAVNYLTINYLEDANPSPFQDIDCPFSPFESDGLFDANELGELSDLPDDVPGAGLLWELDETIGLPDDSLFNPDKEERFQNGFGIDSLFNPDKEERFQNGFGIDMVSHGRYFCPVVHTAKRQDAFLASNTWMGPSPVLHGLPYSYAHRRKGRRHHFAEVIISTSIVAHELGYESPIQYVKARGWTLSKQCKLNYRQIDEILIRNAPGRCADLQRYFHSMVSRLYDIIEKDGLRDPYSNLPAVNFIKRESFIQKLHLHAQEFQMALIILEECFMKHVEHHHEDDVFYWMKKIFHSCRKHADLVTLYNQLWSLFPNGDDPELAKELLQHPDTIRDEVYRKCNSLKHKIRYASLVESGLKSIRRKSRDDKMPKSKNHLLFAQPCSCS
jgi:hypothetical protein